MSIPTIAKTVVYRHPCDCDTASRPLEPGEHAEHRFDVDGEPFPWFITEAGATFAQHGDWFLITVHALMLDMATKAPLRFSHTWISDDWEVHGQPVLGDRQFPWILAAPVVYTVAELGDIPTLTLTFVAANVDTDAPVELVAP